MSLTENDEEGMLAQIDPLQPTGTRWWGHGYEGTVVILDVRDHCHLVLPAWQEVGQAN